MSSGAVKKTVDLILPATRKHWVGDGFNVNPIFGNHAFTKRLSPFLMFDYAEPKEFPPTHKKLGVGMHPHRGFETVTIAFQGEVEHRDSAGHSGTISEGGVQWMTAGKGIFHEEFHSRAFADKGGQFEMCQLWVNLPASLKMTKPRYQEIRKEDIAHVSLPDGAGSVRVIAGEFGEQTGPAKTQFKGGATRGQVQLWDIGVAARQTVSLPIPPGQTAILFARKGNARVGGQALELHRCCILSREGTVVDITAGNSDASLVLMGGDPILDASGEVEPIKAYGPMVMNTDKEINDAMMWAQREQRKHSSSRSR